MWDRLIRNVDGSGYPVYHRPGWLLLPWLRTSDDLRIMMLEHMDGDWKDSNQKY